MPISPSTKAARIASASDLVQEADEITGGVDKTNLSNRRKKLCRGGPLRTGTAADTRSGEISVEAGEIRERLRVVIAVIPTRGAADPPEATARSDEWHIWPVIDAPRSDRKDLHGLAAVKIDEDRIFACPDEVALMNLRARVGRLAVHRHVQRQWILLQMTDDLAHSRSARTGDKKREHSKRDRREKRSAAEVHKSIWSDWEFKAGDAETMPRARIPARKRVRNHVAIL